MKKKSKKMLALLLGILLVAGLSACGAKRGSGKDPDAKREVSSEGKTSLYVFAAASMAETMNEIKEAYEKDHADVEILYSFDSSGTLKTQIQEGANCDLFLSAGQLAMDQMDAADETGANVDGLDLVQSDTRIDLLENKVVLVVPDGNPKGIQDFDDLAHRLQEKDVFLAMGNADVPVGQYTQNILSYYGLKEEELAKAGCLTYGSNVKEVAIQVMEASVDCGIVYGTDAFSAKLTVMDEASPEMCGQVIYPAAVMKNSKHPEAAKAFLSYLLEDSCSQIFKKVGFTPLEKGEK